MTRKSAIPVRDFQALSSEIAFLWKNFSFFMRFRLHGNFRNVAPCMNGKALSITSFLTQFSQIVAGFYEGPHLYNFFFSILVLISEAQKEACSKA